MPTLGAAILLFVALWWSGSPDLTGSLPFAVSLEAPHEAGIAAYAPAHTWLLVRLDLAGLPKQASYQLKMVDGGGAEIWQALAPARDAKAESKIPGTRAGVYSIRVYSTAGELLREFFLGIRDRE